MRHSRTSYLILCGLFAALIAAGAFIRIPMPFVPKTLQLFFITLSGMLLGRKYGCISVLVYIAVGLCGIPVFTGGGGISYVLQPTFGYIIGFAAGAYTAGALTGPSPRPTFRKLLTAALAALAVVYVIGTVYFWFITYFVLGTPVGLKVILVSCILIPLSGDLILCFVCAAAAGRLIPALRSVLN